jgi:hypothetical protein
MMGTDEALAAYVNEGGFQFVAVALTPTVPETGEGGRELEPLKVRYAGPMRYPATMASGNDIPEIRTRIFVEGPENATVTGWSADEVGDVGGPDANEAFDDRLRDLGGDEPGYGVVAARECGEAAVRVTRFESLVEPVGHSTDATFALDGGTTDVGTTIEVGENAWVLLPFLGFGWGLRRRRSGRGLGL